MNEKGKLRKQIEIFDAALLFTGDTVVCSESASEGGEKKTTEVK